MSKRSIRKVRHYNPRPSFKDLSIGGELRKRVVPGPLNVAEGLDNLKQREQRFQERIGTVEEHVHGEGCSHHNH